jgi:putative peptide zinc metalloprotease protein
MWWLVLLLLLLALLLTAANFAPGPAWAEMPTNRALLTVDRGKLTAAYDGQTVTLQSGDRRYVDQGTRIEVADKSTGRLTFQGGSAALLCAGSRAGVGRLYTEAARHRDPHAEVAIDNGRMLADTTSVSGAYRPLSLVVTRPLGNVTNVGAAWYAVDPAALTVSTGQVSVAGQPVTPTRDSLNCGDGITIQPPAAGPSESPSDEPLPSELPSTIPTTTPPPTTTAPAPPVIQPPPNNPPPTPTRPTTKPTTTKPTTKPTTRPTTTPPPTTRPTSSPPTTPPPSSTPPIIIG